jgi:hypothetical protein
VDPISRRTINALSCVCVVITDLHLAFTTDIAYWNVLSTRNDVKMFIGKMHTNRFTKIEIVHVHVQLHLHRFRYSVPENGGGGRVEVVLGTVLQRRCGAHGSSQIMPH